MPSLRDHADEIATSAGDALGMDPFTILTIVTTLLPMFARCFEGKPQTASAYLQDHYDETTKQFDSYLIKRSRPQTRRAARQNGQTRLGKTQLDAITVASFQHALAQPENELASAVVEASKEPILGDDE